MQGWWDSGCEGLEPLIQHGCWAWPSGASKAHAAMQARPTGFSPPPGPTHQVSVAGDSADARLPLAGLVVLGHAAVAAGAPAEAAAAAAQHGHHTLLVEAGQLGQVAEVLFQCVLYMYSGGGRAVQREGEVGTGQGEVGGWWL